MMTIVATVVGFMAVFLVSITVGGVLLGFLYFYDWLERRHRRLAPIVLALILFSFPAWVIGSAILGTLPK